MGIFAFRIELPQKTEVKMGSVSQHGATKHFRRKEKKGEKKRRRRRKKERKKQTNSRSQQEAFE